MYLRHAFINSSPSENSRIGGTQFRKRLTKRMQEVGKHMKAQHPAMEKYKNSLVPRSKHAGAHIPLRKNARNCRHTLRVRRLPYITLLWRKVSKFHPKWMQQISSSRIMHHSKVGKLRKIGIPRRGKPAECWS